MTGAGWIDTWVSVPQPTEPGNLPLPAQPAEEVLRGRRHQRWGWKRGQTSGPHSVQSVPRR